MVEQGLSVASNNSPQTVCCTASFFFLPNTQKSKTCLFMQVDSNPWGMAGITNSQNEGLSWRLHLFATPVAWKSYSHYWLNTVYTCCFCSGRWPYVVNHEVSRGMPRHTDMHTLCLPSWLLNRIENITMQTHLSVAGFFFFVYPSNQDKKRVRVRVTTISECPYPSPVFFC